MNKEQYNSLPEDLKLDARLAITLGHKVFISKQGNLRVYQDSGWVNQDSGFARYWKPRQDPAILWGLLGVGTALYEYNGNWHCGIGNVYFIPAKTKEEALIAAYCEADPHGHWAKWCKDNEATA